MEISFTDSRIHVLGSPLDKFTMSEALGRIRRAVVSRMPLQITAINANVFYLMRRIPLFRETVLHSEMVVPEYGALWACKMLGIPLKKDIYGPMPAVARELFAASAAEGYRIYLLGAKPHVVRQVVHTLWRRHPTLKVVGYHHGYFDADEEMEILDDIRGKQPDVLFVGMGAPKQEMWIYVHKNELKIPVSLGVGGYFDILAGLAKEAPEWIRRSGIEWIYRSQQDARLWKRQLTRNPELVWRVFCELCTKVK